MKKNIARKRAKYKFYDSNWPTRFDPIPIRDVVQLCEWNEQIVRTEAVESN